MSAVLAINGRIIRFVRVIANKNAVLAIAFRQMLSTVRVIALISAVLAITLIQIRNTVKFN